MNRRFLLQIFKAFRMMNFVYAGDDDTGLGGGDGGGDEVAIEDYVGSTEVNPDQVELIDEFDREGKTKDDIDKMLSYAEGELFKTPEQIEEAREAKEKAAKENKGDEDGKGDGGKEDKGSKGDKGKDGEKKDGDKKDDDGEGVDEEGKESDDEKAFFEESGLSREAFNDLPETTQEIIVDKVMSKGEATEEVTNLKKDVDGLNSQISTITGDTVHAARLEEIRTGKSIVAKAENFINDAFLVKMDAAIGADEDSGKADKFETVKKMLFTEINKQLATERAVSEGQRLTTELQNDTWKNLRKLGKIDKRLIIEEKDHRKMVPGHKEYADFEKGTKKVLAWAKESNITNQTLSKMTPKEIYAAFAAHEGWDKEKEINSFKAGRESFIKNLRKPKFAGAKSLKQDKQIAQGSGSTGGSVDRATLKAELMEGKTENYEFMLGKHEGDPAKISELMEIFEDARDARSKAA